MIEVDLLTKFNEQFGNLKEIVQISRDRSIGDPQDELFARNQNVFVKLYLVSACSMLEAFIQDLASAYVKEIQSRINSSNLPFNLVMWSADHDKAKLEFKRFRVEKTSEDISGLLSPNYWKTIQAFKRIGVDLSTSSASAYKDFVVTIVEKRNRIVHNNDAALDLSFSDIIDTINTFQQYTSCLFEAVSSDTHLSTA